MSIVLGVLAATTLRMKCFWTPYVCILSSVSVADETLWNLLLSKTIGSKNIGVMNILRNISVAILIFVLYHNQRPV